MSRVVYATVLYLITFSTCASPAAAQNLRTYFGGSLAGASWGAHPVSGGSPSTSYDNSTTQSVILGVKIDAGYFVGRSSSLGVELDLPFDRSTIAQKHNYILNPYKLESRYREQTIFAVFRRQVQTGRHSYVVFVGGGGLVRGSSLDRIASFDTRLNAYAPYHSVNPLTRYTMGMTGGVDLAIEATPDVSVVPQFRIVAIRRGSPEDGDSFFGTLGLRSVVYRFGLGLRVAF